MKFLSKLFVFPASIYYHRNVRQWLRERRTNPQFYQSILMDPLHIRRRLIKRNPLWQSIVCAGLLMARQMESGANPGRALSSVWKVYRQSGGKGVRARVIDTGGQVEDLGKVLIDPKKILVVDYRLPRADVSAGERATVGILRSLVALGYEVTFVANDFEDHPTYRSELEALGVVVQGRAQGHQSVTQYLVSQAHVFGVIYLIRVDIAEQLLPVIEQFASFARLIFHAPDLYFLRERRQAELSQDAVILATAAKTREREFSVMRRTDHTVVVSAAEAEVLRQAMPELSISVFNALYVDVTERSYVAQQRKGLFFIGGFAHTPNVDAVIWFVRKVWPLIRLARPDAEFDILGAEAPPSVVELKDEPGVNFVGYVADLDQAFATYRVGVAPLRYGAGIKGKVAATMGAGIPMACTTIAAEGMGIIGEQHALVADDEQLFADAVCRLLADDDLCNAMSVHGRQLVTRRFGDEANHTAFTALLNEARVLDQSLYLSSIERGLRTDDGLRLQQVSSIPARDEVDVSIIIPVYNQWALTERCLYSIVKSLWNSDHRLEIIVADDGSTDQTRLAASAFPAVAFVRGEANRGFLRNCNAAAAQARGRYLLLLNNDTVVFPGWLDHLLATLQADDSIAIAGSKLLYPDGSIQEAGSSLFRDGKALNIGRGFGRYDPRVDFEREVDYISGASILVRRSFWDSMGGFDERYVPAYCEDSDLAMSARQQGFRVVYQPMSEVIHFEHGSYAEQETQKPKVLQEKNLVELVKKWQPVFDRDHLPPTDWVQAAAHAQRTLTPRARERRQGGKLNVLYFSPFPSHPTNHGNRATIYEFASHFKKLGHAVHFVLLDEENLGEDVLADMRGSWDTVDVLSTPPFPICLDGELPFDAWYVEGLGEHIMRWCRTYDIDIVFCSYVFQSKLLEYVPAHVLKVIDTHDKMGGRYDMLRRNGMPVEFFSCSPEDEGRYLNRADLVVARRREEADYFDGVIGTQKSVVIPHVEPARYLTLPFGDVTSVGIVASANRINLMLVRDFLREVDRRASGQLTFKIHVAGQVADMVAQLSEDDAALFRRDWVVMRGFVKSISDFYQEMDMIVAPVIVGTGINVKTVQAMAYGVPLLTTRFGAKGVPTVHPMHQFEGVAEMVDGLLRIVDQPAVLEELAQVSREVYDAFHRESIRGFDTLFQHPKTAT